MTDVEYTYSTRDVRVVFGPGCVKTLADELDTLGLRRVLLVTTSGRARDASVIRGLLGVRLAGIFDGSRQHVPVEIVRGALDLLRHVSPDVILSLGGGSAVGLGKLCKSSSCV